MSKYGVISSPYFPVFGPEITPYLDTFHTVTAAGTFVITNTNLCVLVVTLPTQDNTKLLQQLNSEFKRTINWNKYVTKDPVHSQNRNLDYLVNSSFQGVNRLFVLSFENEEGRRRYAEYYLPKVEIKDYSVKIKSGNF